MIDEGIQFTEKQFHEEFERVLSLRRSRVRQLNRANPDAHCMVLFIRLILLSSFNFYYQLDSFFLSLTTILLAFY